MNKFKKTLITVVSCFATIFSYAQEPNLRNSQNYADISQTWQQFLTTISTKDKLAFKKLSDTTINCYECLENTTEELNAINHMRMNDSTWYERIYEDMIYVPIADFITDDFDLIFTPSLVKILKSKKPIFNRNDIDKSIISEVLITGIEPNEEFEGMQYVFAFKMINGVLKFTQLNTIP